MAGPPKKKGCRGSLFVRRLHAGCALGAGPAWRGPAWRGAAHTRLEALVEAAAYAAAAAGAAPAQL
jgi:hypothetical protein